MRIVRIGHALFFGVTLSFGGLFLLTGCGGGNSSQGAGTVQEDLSKTADRNKMIESAYAKKK